MKGIPFSQLDFSAFCKSVSVQSLCVCVCRCDAQRKIKTEIICTKNVIWCEHLCNWVRFWCVHSWKFFVRHGSFFSPYTYINYFTLPFKLQRERGKLLTQKLSPFSEELKCSLPRAAFEFFFFHSLYWIIWNIKRKKTEKRPICWCFHITIIVDFFATHHCCQALIDELKWTNHFSNDSVIFGFSM